MSISPTLSLEYLNSYKTAENRKEERLQLKARNKQRQQQILQSTVVLTINNHTNRIVSVESTSPIPGVKPGKFIRTSLILLLIRGYQQISQFRGDKFTVIGYVLQQQPQIPKSSVLLTINNRTNRLLVVTSSAPGPGINAGIFVREGMSKLLMRGFRQVTQFTGDQFTVIGYILK